MEKLLIASVLSVVLFSSCEKDMPTPIVEDPTKLSTFDASKYKFHVTNGHPTKKITGVYIGGVLQKLDIGNYPIGYGQEGYAKTFSPICENVYYPNGCKTELRITYSGEGKFENVYVFGRSTATGVISRDLIDVGTISAFTWNSGINIKNSSLQGIVWGTDTVKKSADVWSQLLFIGVK